MFINFLCEPDVGLANCEFIGYSTPLDSVREMLPEELANNPIAYLSAEVLANTEAFTVLPDEINAAMDAAWSDMKSYDEEGGGWVVPVFLILALAMTCFNVWRRRRRKKRREMY